MSLTTMLNSAIDLHVMPNPANVEVFLSFYQKETYNYQEQKFKRLLGIRVIQWNE